MLAATAAGVRMMDQNEALITVTEAAAALAAAPDCVKILSETGLIQFVNAYGLILLEADSVEQVLGKPYWGLWPVAMHSAIQSAIQNARGGQVTQIEGFRSTVKGTLRYWEARFHGIEVASRKHEVICIARDLTDRREREVRLAVAETHLLRELAEADRRKTEFIATLAHELRNPLAPVRTGLAVLKEAVDMASVSRVREIMERQVEQMVHLVNDLLDTARVTSGKLALQTARVDLKAIIGSATDATATMMSKFHHRLTVHLPEGPIELNADSTRLAQIFTNLLNNAAKFTPAGGLISLTVDTTDTTISVSVVDSGVGLTEADLTSIFDMFTSVGRDTAGLHEGLGIGLNLVRRLVEMHGGSVIARSQGLGKGSEFIVTLPRPQVRGEARIHDVTKGTSAPVKILVVDDNIDAATTLTMLLENQRHELRMASSGEEALRVVREFSPEIIFLDIGMPQMDGYQVARAIRALPSSGNPILVALTGWGGAKDRELSKAAGFNEHLTKPADLAAIESMLAKLHP
jgi:signal transduction histidine kinase